MVAVQSPDSGNNDSNQWADAKPVTAPSATAAATAAAAIIADAHSRVHRRSSRSDAAPAQHDIQRHPTPPINIATLHFTSTSG